MKLKWKSEGMKTPMARAKGLGSAHDGAHHWMAERITSVALVPLTLWFCWSIVSMAGADYFAFTGWLQQPINAILMLLLVSVGIYHALMGCQVVIEDYIHHEGFKMIKLIGLKLFMAALGVACVFSILKIAL